MNAKQRTTSLAANVPHVYADKFALAEWYVSSENRRVAMIPRLLLVRKYIISYHANYCRSCCRCTNIALGSYRSVLRELGFKSAQMSRVRVMLAPICHLSPQIDTHAFTDLLGYYSPVYCVATVQEWGRLQESVTLRFDSEESCKLLREQSREVHSLLPVRVGSMRCS